MKAAKRTAPARATMLEHAIDGIPAYVREARADLVTLIALYAQLDGDPDVLGGTRGNEMRKEANEAAARMLSALDAIQGDIGRAAREHAALAMAVTS